MRTLFFSLALAALVPAFAAHPTSQAATPIKVPKITVAPTHGTTAQVHAAVRRGMLVGRPTDAPPALKAQWMDSTDPGGTDGGSGSGD